MKVVICIAMLLALPACGPMQAVTREYYDPPTENKNSEYATVTGSDTLATANAKAIRTFVGSIDKKSVSLPKKARCNFDKKYALTEGSHLIGVSITIGPDYTKSLVGYAEVPLFVVSGLNYIAKAELRPRAMATVWIEDAPSGRVVSNRIEIALKDSPQKGIPVGFGLIADSCAMP